VELRGTLWNIVEQGLVSPLRFYKFPEIFRKNYPSKAQTGMVESTPFSTHSRCASAVHCCASYKASADG